MITTFIDFHSHFDTCLKPLFPSSNLNLMISFVIEKIKIMLIRTLFLTSGSTTILNPKENGKIMPKIDSH